MKKYINGYGCYLTCKASRMGKGCGLICFYGETGLSTVDVRKFTKEKNNG